MMKQPAKFNLDAKTKRKKQKKKWRLKFQAYKYCRRWKDGTQHAENLTSSIVSPSQKKYTFTVFTSTLQLKID